MAEWLTRLTVDQDSVSSILTVPIYAPLAQWLRHLSYKQGILGSSPRGSNFLPSSLIGRAADSESGGCGFDSYLGNMRL